MSPAGRAQFAWPTPGFPQLEEGQVRPGTNKQTFDVAEEVTADGSPAHDNFCLVVMDVKEVTTCRGATGGTCTSRTREGVGYHRGEPLERRTVRCARRRDSPKARRQGYRLSAAL